MQAAESGAIRWLVKNPEATDPNRVMAFRWIEFPRMPFGFYNDPTTSQGKETVLRDVTREGDHWLITVEGPSHQIATLVIDDRDHLVDVHFETKQVPK